MPLPATATFLLPMPRLFRVTFFFFWSVARAVADTVRPWYMNVELSRSFWNFFISGALADGAYLEVWICVEKNSEQM